MDALDMEMGFVMTSQTIKIVTMMVETVVDLMLTQNIAQNVNAWVVLNQVGLGMGFVMTSLTIQSVPMMVETVVDLMLIQNIVKNVNVLTIELVEIE